MADIDNDGDLDLAVVDLDGPVRNFENVIGRRESWIRIEPRVSGSLTDLHFGLGDSAAARRIEVVWRGGQTQTFQDIAARRLYTIVRGGPLEARPGI